MARPIEPSALSRLMPDTSSGVAGEINATRVTVAVIGTIMALAGLEHGIGEILRGNRAPAGMTIVSWPDSVPFRLLGGEPAMTIIPNLLVTGILARLVSLLVLVWVTRFIQHRHGGLVLLLLKEIEP